MHELSLMRNVVRTVLMAAEKNSTDKVKSYTLPELRIYRGC